MHVGGVFCIRRCTQIGEGTRLESGQAGKPAWGFESLHLRLRPGSAIGRRIRFKPGKVRVRIPPGSFHALIAERNRRRIKDPRHPKGHSRFESGWGYSLRFPSRNVTAGSRSRYRQKVWKDCGLDSFILHGNGSLPVRDLRFRVRILRIGAYGHVPEQEYGPHSECGVCGFDSRHGHVGVPQQEDGPVSKTGYRGFDSPLPYSTFETKKGK